MDAELKAKWIAALRSGEYKQGNGRLRDGDKYCCLGVLCDVSGAGRWQDDWYYDNSGGANCYLPESLSIDIDRDTQGTLAVMNDGNILPPATLDEIADYIEANL